MPYHERSLSRLLGKAARHLLWLLLLACSTVGALARPDLDGILSQHPPSLFFPGATSYQSIEENSFIRAVRTNGRVVGYIFLNTDFDSAIGYSGKPISILIGITPQATIAGARLVDHSEPIVLAGVPENEIVSFIEAYKGFNLTSAVSSDSITGPQVDIVSGATVTVLVIDDSIRNSALRVASAIGLEGFATSASQHKRKATVILSSRETFDWTGLIGNGSVRRLKLTNADVNRAFERYGLAANKGKISGREDGLFIELYVASLAVPAIANSLLGEAEYKNLQGRTEAGEQAVLIMGRGPFSFKGSGYVRGGIFDRVQLVQAGTSIRFRDRGHKRLRRVAADGAPDFREVGIFRLPKDAKFDPAASWRLQLLVPRRVGALKKAFTTFEVSYRLPEEFLKIEAREPPSTTERQPNVSQSRPPSTELWLRIWRQKIFEVAILIVGIMALTVIFFFQDYLVKYPVLTRRVRTGFLLFTLIWIGWYAQAQLSVVNVLVFANALIGEFRWEYFLREPLIFILWCSVAASLLFWGRGAFCGWLCPFGALQELTNRTARYFKLPQISVPWAVHERVWPIKYLIFLFLLGYSVYSLAGAELFAEVEPFKTAIVLRFVREWPYVAFALALLTVGLFIERFYCRYLCPLGAALAIPGKLAMFDWLKRYRNCGDPCHLCAQDCMVQAITPMGDINPNECLHCLNCQVKYHDASVCPVVILKAAKAGKTDSTSPSDEAVQHARDLHRRPRRLGQSRAIEPEFSADELNPKQGGTS